MYDSRAIQLPRRSHRGKPLDARSLTDHIEGHYARITVIGQGDVGLPLAIEFAEAGFVVTGLDTSRARVAALNDGRSPIPDVTDKALQALRVKGRYGASSDLDVLQESDVVIICAPTPLGDSEDLDSAFVMAATERVGGLHMGQLVILESTNYPGILEGLLQPLFSGKRDEHFFLTFSPERNGSAAATSRARDIPRTVSGVTPECSRLAALLYSQIAPKVMQISRPQAAEMNKLYEDLSARMQSAPLCV